MIFKFTIFPSNLKKIQINIYAFLNHFSILIDLIQRTFSREHALYLACNKERDFLTSDEYKNYNLWSCQNVCESLVYLLDIFVDLELNFIDKL